MSIKTSIGRVVPGYLGAWDTRKTYEKLDSVLYEGSTYIAKEDVAAGIAPSSTQYWQMIASKGEQGEQGITGSFGTPSGTAEILPSGSNPTVTVSADGPDTAKVFSFNFGIPAGPVGYDDVAASATSLSPSAPPTAAARLVTEDETTTLEFTFGIPAAEGEGIKKIDGDVEADATGNASLNAVRYTSQSLSNAEKIIARNNIHAQEAGSYIEEPSPVSSGQFLQYSNDGEWKATTINLVPTGSQDDVGRYLRKTNSGLLWADVQSLPSGGAEGVPLVKKSVDDYDVRWGTIISTNDIDAIINAD